MLHTADKNVYVLVKKYSDECISMFDKVVNYLRTTRSNELIYYAALRNERKDQMKLGYIPTPDQVAEEVWQNVLLLNWTKNYTIQYQDEIQPLAEKGKRLIELIRKTDHRPLKLRQCSNEEVYLEYIEAYGA
ncbi:hypothetical protein D3C81_544350 [compost metagenome]